MKTLSIVLLLFVFTGIADAKPKKGPAKAKPSSQSPTDGSSKEIDFEGEVIEGMNRQPLDSLTSLSEGDSEDRSKGHVYRRKKTVADENKEATREILETY